MQHKLRYVIGIFALGVLCAGFFAYKTDAQLSGGSGTINQLSQWMLSGGYVKTASTTAGLQVQGLANCNTIDTDGDGKFTCGTDATGGTGSGSSLHATTSADTFVYPLGGRYHSAPYYVATSSTASTFPYASSTALTVTDLFTGTIKSGTWNGTAIADAYVGALPRYVFDRVGKNGWDLDYTDSVDLSFATSTRTFTITPSGASFEYWIQGTKYTSAATSTTITDTEGNWFIYFNTQGNIEASQTPWVIGANDKAFIASGYWDADNNSLITLDAELHSWVMDASVHRIMHSTFGTRYGDGLAVAINGANLDITGGSIYDEDIKIAIVDDDTPDTEWEQALTPANVRTLYRTGASGYWRATTSSTTPIILQGTDMYINTYTLGSWGLETVAANKYVAYWVIASGDVNSPVFMVPGQESGDTLAAARNGNQLADMDFSNLAIQEYRVIARILVQKTAAAPYYTLAEVNDYRNVMSEPTSSFTAADHGGLTGLLDDDHTQYGALAQNEVVTGAWTFYGSTTGLYFVATSSTASTFPYASSTAYTITDLFTGTIRSGTWNGSTIGIAYGGTNATSFGSHMITAFDGTSLVSTSTPTAARYIATSTTASSFPYSSSTAYTITDLWAGTVRTGTWNGSTIGIAYGGTNATTFGSHMLTAFNGTSIVSTSTPTAAAYIATSTAATSSLPRLTVSGLLLGSDYVTDITGTGLAISSGSLIVDVAATYVWTGTHDFSSAVVKIHKYPGFSFPPGIASATTTTATTSVPIGTAYVYNTFNGAECWSGAGTVQYQISDGTNKTATRAASTTASRFTYSSSNTFATGTKRFIEIGPMTSSYLSCTFDITER